MSLLASIFSGARKTVAALDGAQGTLNGVAAAVANVIAADGNIEDAEIDAAVNGMVAHPSLKAFTPAQIEQAVGDALRQAKSRFGRNENNTAIAALTTKPAEIRQGIFLIAADVADQGGIGDKEHAALENIAKALGVDKAKLLAA